MVVIIAAISTLVLFTALYMALPGSVEVYHRFMRNHFVECPDNHQQSTVTVSPAVAAGTSVIAGTVLFVKGCTRWPEHRGCRRHCRSQLR